MIQEPQQPEIIEIPVVNQLLNTTVQNSVKNQSNLTHSKTLIQIQPQNSKPRIFLLTRPSKSRLVRLETQRVQTHHPQKIATATLANIATQQQELQKKIIRIPFLPRSQVQTLSVKSNTNQTLKKDSIFVPQDTVQYTNESHNTDQRSSQTQTQTRIYPIIQEEIKQTNQLSPTSTETSSNQSVKNTIHKSTEQKINQSETKTQSLAPLTLASMAGIELTGADMSLSQADMSGAMPPTATVEEINVPVFIDEYLQEATAASTTSVTTNNIFNINNNNNNNNNISNNTISNNNQSNEKGNEVNNCLDAFENFEFDIDLLTENNNNKNKDITATIELQDEKQQQQQLQQHQLTEVDNDKKEEHQLELQLMLEDILFNNKNNSSNNNHTSCKTLNIFNNNNINTTTSNNDNTLNNNNNNMNNMAKTFDLTDEFDSTDLFKVAPYSQMSEDILTPDDIDENLSLGMELAMELSNAEYAVDINCMTNEPSLNECFLHSQPSDIMLSSGYGPSSSLSSSQNLINEISKAEPHIPDSTYSVLPTTSSIAMESGLCEAANEDTQYDWATTQCNIENPAEEWKENKTLHNSLKRQSPQTTSKHMQEKRLKLRLDTKPCKENILSQQTEISTPNVINLIMNEEFAIAMGPTAENSIDSIYNQLISSSPTCASIKSEIICEDTSASLSPPNTPYSVNSISNQTNFTGFSAPSSPASSITTITTNTSVSTKRGRGRPAKQHSYIPHPSQIQHLTETEQKKILERAKNNEASRKSRLKHKERDNALEREERELEQRNFELNTNLKEYKRMEKKLRKALERQYLQNLQPK